MKITAMDINSKEFKRGFRGYAAEEVDEFLDKIAEDYENLYKDNSALKEKLFVTTEKLEHYIKMETTIQNTLLLAQNAADQAKVSSQKEAEITIKNANDSAQKILDKAHNDVVQINTDYESIKHEFAKFRAKFRNFLNTQIDMFSSMENEFLKTYNIGNTVEENEAVREKEVEVEEFKVKTVEEEPFRDDLNAIKSFFAKNE